MFHFSLRRSKKDLKKFLRDKIYLNIMMVSNTNYSAQIYTLVYYSDRRVAIVDTLSFR